MSKQNSRREFFDNRNPIKVRTKQVGSCRILEQDYILRRTKAAIVKIGRWSLP
jgi:hypothetical protein